MAPRLSRIATRSGDDGSSTGMADGQRLPKHHARVHALGEVDELNAHLGLLLCESLPDLIRTLLLQMQHDLFDLGGALALPGQPVLREASLIALDTALEDHNASLPPLAEFILPGGTRAGAQAHVCRTVARRAERAVAALLYADSAHPNDSELLPLRYLNRLSDLLFILARQINRLDGRNYEILWNSRKQNGEN